MNGQGGRPEGFCHRQMLDAVRYLVAEGVRWASLPADFPKWRAVYRFFRRWRDNDLIKELYGRLRRRLCELAGKKEEPTAAIIDSQSVKADATVGAATRGYDAGKKINGRKRHIAVETLGLLLLLLLLVMVTAALGQGQRRRPRPAGALARRTPPHRPGLGRRRLHRLAGRLRPRRPRPRPDRRQALRRRRRVRGAAPQVDRGTVLLLADPGPAPGPRLRDPHRQRPAMAWWAASIPATRRLARSGRPSPRRVKRSAA